MKKATDRFLPEQRSLIMSQVKNKNTLPEKTVRSYLHRLGYRFRLHPGNLPGNPDIVLKKYNAVIFVNDCFSHGHPGCKKATRPATNVEFWDRKLAINIQRDRLYKEMLQKMGWKILIVWECEIKNTDSLLDKLVTFLDTQES